MINLSERNFLRCAIGLKVLASGGSVRSKRGSRFKLLGTDGGSAWSGLLNRHPDCGWDDRPLPPPLAGGLGRLPIPGAGVSPGFSPGCADTVPSPCPHMGVPLSTSVSCDPLLIKTPVTSAQVQLVTSSNLSHLCKDPVSKYAHTFRSWGLGRPHKDLEEQIQPKHVGIWNATGT